MQVWRTDFGSMGEFLDFLDTPSTWATIASSKDTNRPDWHGTPDYETANRLVREGWPKGRKLMGDMLAKMPVIGRATRTMQAYALDRGGAYPIVPLAIAGDPMHMVSIGEEQRATRPFVRFEINRWASAGVSAETIMKMGAAILAWIDALENAGARCEIVIVGASEWGQQRLETKIMTKRAEEHFDVDRLAYAIAQPSMLRRHLFRLVEHAPAAWESSWGSTYGSPADIAGDGNAVRFTQQHWSDAAWHNPVTAVARVRDMIAQACGEQVAGLLEAA